MTASSSGPTSISSPQPNHAPPSFYPEHEKKNRTLRFQGKWYTAFPWLHYEPGINGVLCFYCLRAGPQSIVKSAEPAFSESGFHQWNRANESFNKYQASHAHKAALAQWLQQKKPVVTQLSVHHASNQATARNNLVTIFRCSIPVTPRISFAGPRPGGRKFAAVVTHVRQIR